MNERDNVLSDQLKRIERKITYIGRVLVYSAVFGIYFGIFRPFLDQAEGRAVVPGWLVNQTTIPLWLVQSGAPCLVVLIGVWILKPLRNSN
jgi:hypothetical protein